MPSKWDRVLLRTGCSQTRSPDGRSSLVLWFLSMSRTKLHLCFPAGVKCQLLTATWESESAFCMLNPWVGRQVDALLAVTETTLNLFISTCTCPLELDGFLLCLHTVLTFCKFNGHVVIHSYPVCFHSLLFYCILTANSFICIPPPYSFTSFSKRLHGDDVRNPFWPSFPFSLPPSFHAFVCSPS